MIVGRSLQAYAYRNYSYADDENDIFPCEFSPEPPALLMHPYPLLWGKHILPCILEYTASIIKGSVSSYHSCGTQQSLTLHTDLCKQICTKLVCKAIRLCWNLHTVYKVCGIHTPRHGANTRTSVLCLGDVMHESAAQPGNRGASCYARVTDRRSCSCRWTANNKSQ